MTKASPPQLCDVCEGVLKSGATYFDAAIPGHPYYGLWAWACSGCADIQGVKTGTGKGQEYDSKTDEKVRG